MKVPAEWMHTPRVTYRVLNEALVSFFSSSKCISAVVCYWEEMRPGLGGGFGHKTMHAAYNELARHPLTERQFYGPRPNATGEVRLARQFLESLRDYCYSKWETIEQ
jgi:hypothetical protein